MSCYSFLGEPRSSRADGCSSRLFRRSSSRSRLYIRIENEQRCDEGYLQKDHLLQRTLFVVGGFPLSPTLRKLEFTLGVLLDGNVRLVKELDIGTEDLE